MNVDCRSKAKSPLHYSFVFQLVCLCARSGLIKSISLFIFVPKHENVFISKLRSKSPFLSLTMPLLPISYSRQLPCYYLIWRNRRSLCHCEPRCLYSVTSVVSNIERINFYFCVSLLKLKCKIAKAGAQK